MTLKIFDLLSIVLSALVLGVFWGPWLAVSRSISTFTADVFLAVVHRMDRNLSAVMTVLMPVALWSTIPVLFTSYNERDGTFLLTAAGFGLFVLTLLVTGLVDVPIVKKIRPWTVSTLPGTGNSFVTVGNGSTSSEWPGELQF